MDTPQRFSELPEYAFARLRAHLDGIAPGGPVVDMTIGAPRHPMPPFVGEVLAANLDGFRPYPVNEGNESLRAGIAEWLARRYGVTRDPAREIMALNGTREGLFNAAIALCPETKAGARPAVLIPNPFYQVYEVAARAVGAEPVHLPATEATGFLPDLDALPEAVLRRTALVYLCSPSNPQGAVADAGYGQRLLDLAERFDFRILADECYSEIWRDTPPPGALEVADAAGADPERVLAFHSLSKRSNMPGLRSGFVAGGPGALTALRQLRAYAGAPLPGPLQAVAEAAWRDETHVAASRALYQEKFRVADDILRDMPGYRPPPAGFFLWLPVPGRLGDGEAAARMLWARTGVRVLPGAYLGRAAGDGNPGDGHIRVALVADRDEVAQGLTALRDCFQA